METSDSDEPEKKRPHLNNSGMARHPNPSPENGTVDATVLQYQNQKLVQQLDVQKQELHDLEDKIKELRQEQTSYDDFLIKINQLWSQLDDDLILLGVRAGAGQSALEALQHADSSRGSIPSCPAEEIFLCRLLQSDSIGKNGSEERVVYIKEALALRHSSTLKLMNLIEDTIQAKIESIDQSFHENSSAEDAIIHLNKIDDLMKDEINNLKTIIEALHVKHKEYADMIQSYTHSNSVDQSEIKRVAGDLEDSMAELEESRRKLVNLKMQKDRLSNVQPQVPFAVNGNINISPENTVDKTMGLRDLKDSIEEAKIVASDRLSELHEAEEDNMVLSKQLHDLQNELKDNKYIYTSRPYTLLNDQLPYWKSELERFRVVIDSLQVDRFAVMRKEKELSLKTESVNALKNPIDNNTDSIIEDLEKKLQQCINENNELEIKMEEAVQDSERKDIKGEFEVMRSALSKEIGMMTSQLNKWKETGSEAIKLQEEAHSLRALVEKKTSEHKELVDNCSEQSLEIKNLQAHIERLQKENLESQIFLDMLGQRIYDNRDLMEIKESERRAHSQAEVLKNAFEEHSLELRIKSAKETEVACQQRLSITEAEIADLRAKLDDSDRDVLELEEAIKIKDGEAESYISEIETIGQAYEDMQTQNQHLLQQVMERDDYNIKLVSESVKMKQTHSALLSEKQNLEKHLQQVNSAFESLKSRIAHSEEHMNVCVTQALKSTEEDRHLAVNLENSKWELSNADKELKCLKSLLSSSEKEYDQIRRKMEEIQEELDNERMDRKKLDEELVELNMKVTELTLGSGEAAIKKLEEEIKECKSILKCGVCFDRPKEVVIVKCYHLFCNPCIQRNLEIRHRKCPGCGMAFGQNDVRFVKI
ncbi:hypothetical protein L2E82_05029 [Cichorium intybus]|uniref:Uncharacterized protein n=1 Tax=Cichorium intybus TaxID=13427 RepID=A0ACB9H6Y3_CICIN|nr:hypothetical protein L2E82_05029 [Cichorium intybus]